MSLIVSLSVPTFSEPIEIPFEAGTATVIIGANGSGKTRFGVYVDRTVSSLNLEAHRIAAQRSIKLNPAVLPTSIEVADANLRFGTNNTKIGKDYFRWDRNPETASLNDYDFLLAALYAEENDLSVKFRRDVVSGLADASNAPQTKLDILKSIWERVLPHRKLVILGGNIKTRSVGSDEIEYSASEMSDGERVVFYLIGQSLMARPRTILVFDEPELHINRSILNKIWDEIEAIRSDCAIIYITHDVEFSSSRRSAKKYVCRAYQKLPVEAWDIVLLPDESELPDDIVATISGSRRPIVFVEGDGGGLDSSIYRRIYDQFTVIPVGSCDQVIHTVTTFLNRADLHRVGCAGIIDRDGRSDEEIASLERRGIFVLPVSEVENLLLLPGVFLSICASLQFSSVEGQSKLESIKEYVFSRLEADKVSVSIRIARRVLDRKMKSIGLHSSGINELSEEFTEAIKSIDIVDIYSDSINKIDSIINNKEYNVALKVYDNKGLLSEASRLVSMNQKTFENYIVRSLRATDTSILKSALLDYLPSLELSV